MDDVSGLALVGRYGYLGPLFCNFFFFVKTTLKALFWRTNWPSVVFEWVTIYQFFKKCAYHLYFTVIFMLVGCLHYYCFSFCVAFSWLFQHWELTRTDRPSQTIGCYNKLSVSYHTLRLNTIVAEIERVMTWVTAPWSRLPSSADGADHLLRGFNWIQHNINICDAGVGTLALACLVIIGYRILSGWLE